MLFITHQLPTALEVDATIQIGDVLDKQQEVDLTAE